MTSPVEQSAAFLHLLALFTFTALALAAPSPERNIAREVTTTTVSYWTPTSYYTPVITSSACPTPCGDFGQLCCNEGETCYTDANSQAQCGGFTTTVSFRTPTSYACPTPCGYYGQLCCSEGETCYTDINSQAQCGTSSIQTSPTCPLWTTSTETIFTTFTTNVEFVVTYTRSESGILTMIRTASWQIEPKPTDCCAPPAPQDCNYSLGETPCGKVCCAAGQYCQSDGACVAVNGPTFGSDNWEYSTTTFVETGLQTVTSVYSWYAPVTTVTVSTVVVPVRPTSETLVTIYTTTAG